jgi:hypothetical protein
MELLADLLKERIYATFALVAVLVSIDPTHTTPLRAILFVAGTIFSLWAASLIASQMSQRLVFQDAKNHDKGLHLSLLRHSAMLYTLPFPLLLIGLSYYGLIDLETALHFSLAASFLLFIIWTVQSTKTIKASKLAILLLIVLQALFIVGTISLKVIVSH